MPRPRVIPSCLALVFLLFIALPGFAQDRKASAETASTPVSFNVATESGGNVFRIGERIPLELTFTSPAEKTYRISLATYDRSGRMTFEQFAVQPDSGWSDPLKSYFSSLAGFIGGGISGFDSLSEKPVRMTLQLNEWVRFDVPGRYRVRLTTQRVARIKSPGESETTDPSQAFESNELALTIVAATKEWQGETLQKALAIIDRYPAGAPQPTMQQQSDELHLAIKTLRYLGTEAAAREMARRVNYDDGARDYFFGLVASTEREAARKELRQLLSDPEYAVTQEAVNALADLSIDPEETPEAARQTREDAYKRITAELWEAISGKRGSARSATLGTAFVLAGGNSVPSGAVRQLAESFDELPPARQAELIEYHSDLLKSPEMLPILRKYAAQYQDFPVLNESKAYDAIHLSGAALRLWYALDPAGARTAVIDEIARPKPRFDARTLGMLPDESLPELEQSLVDRLASSENFQISGNLASLIARYATSAVLPRMLAIVDANVGKWACATQAPALAYLLRIDPASARSRIEAAMDARGNGFTACNRSLLVELGQMHNDPLLEQIANRYLWDKDPQVAGNAAAFLGTFGSAEAEGRLWDRFERWNNEWRGRESELQFRFGESNPNQEENGLGQNLAQALEGGQSWLADPAKLEKIGQLSIDRSQREQMEHLMDAWHAKWMIHCSGGVDYPPQGQCSVLQYGSLDVAKLKEKLAEFPAGSKFVWVENVAPNAPEQDTLYRDLADFLSGKGMTLSKAE